MPNSFDVYAFRPGPPDYWPNEAKQWAARLLEGSPVTYALQSATRLGPQLVEAHINEFWMPLDRVAHFNDERGAFELVGRPLSGAGLGVILVWIDGTTHEGVAPRSPADLVHLYHVGRMELEAGWNAGVLDALSEWEPASIGA